MQVADYLSNVLQQRGPNSLPYGEDVKWIVREHLMELQKVFPSLGISVSEFYTPDGRRQQLLKADGTIPVHYQGSKYNIPIVIWLTDRYPRVAPMAYVVPTPTMVIKSGHTYVDRNGQCSPPLLHTWNYPQNNNLVELALQLSQIFGAEPPLYSQPAGAAAAATAAKPHASSSGGGGGGASSGGLQPPKPPALQPPASYPSVSSQSYPGATGFSETATHPIWGAAYMASLTGSAGGSASGPGPASSGYGSAAPAAAAVGGVGALAAGGRPPPPPPPPPLTMTRQDIEGPARKLAVAALLLQLGGAERAYTESAAHKMDEALEVQRRLRERKTQLQGMVDMLKQEREGTEGVVKEMGRKSEQLQAWLEANEPKAFLAAEASDQELLKSWVPVNDLSQLALEAHAEDLAIEDTMLALDRALHAEKSGLSVDMYHKQTRALCRRQFFARALSLKVSAQQAKSPASAQAHVPGQTLPYPIPASGSHPNPESWGWMPRTPPPPPGTWPPPPPPQLHH